MKLIAMMPVRNDAHFLPASLGSLEQFCDQVFVVVDEQTTDNSVAVAKSFAKVQVLTNATPSGSATRSGALVKARSLLFGAFRSFDGRNIGLCTDADEIPPPRLFSGLKDAVAAVDRPGSIFALWWVQLWKSLDAYRDDQSVWSNSWKPMLFHDDRQLSYPEGQGPFHESRTPVPASPYEVARLAGFPVLHLQWAYWDRTQFKQAWCRVNEYLHQNFTGAAGINARYAITLSEPNEGLTAAPREWFDGVSDLPRPDAPMPNWHREQILLLFDQYGIRRFEPLQIWHIAELRACFGRQVGRDPVADVYGAPNRSLPFRIARRVLPAPVRAVMRRILT